ncbi:SURF1 family protein [Celeribacter indicus]|uniref:SURF1-like protein n=1 Tax=Celeribacter indicus TaxID=1208324 RepID=A0A0B5E6U3_9RHOB|nr:SURF1 family protein [Celeribacter indicus]AJE48047.1 putative SURF1 family protein [Celeribacter indicus]SDW30590.1 surfeit locus 1 family protein [Celeribacter indicus]
MRLSARLLIATLVAVIGVAGFTSLGIWQVQRLGWKLDLIERVEARIHADPVPAPGPEDWPAITAESDEYTRVTLTGRFLDAEEVLIYTPSDFGPADYVLTPLARDDGTVVMVNRGIVPLERAQAGDYTRVAGETTVTGLLRISEDEGWLFSRDNDPDNGLWNRRDIGSITAALGLRNAAPYFVDQELTDPQGWPRGGQTVVHFRNAHLGYALTWFTLAAVVAGGYVLLLRLETRGRGQGQG